MHNTDERSMLSLLKKGNNLVFTHIYTTYGGLVHYHALVTLKDAAAADDVLQEVFSRLWENRKEIDVDVPLKDYLYHRTQEACVEYELRRKNLANELPDIEDEVDGHSELARKEFLAKIHEAILQVYPPACREILRMHVVEHKNYKEIARDMKITVEVVRNQICKARKSLRDILGLS
ncbi:sigma-70 family RNA polymerase sigma factor [Chitinophaga sp.]|uniref:RNA polymerase sigma factor n=1 Tax=Chitinophaga sp. TaxID=1869181 RepID=UPI0031D0B619